MYVQRIRYLLVLGVGGLLGLMSFARIGHAQTIIDEGGLRQNTVWTEVGSPYIIEDQVHVPSDKTLVIESGTTIIASSSMIGYSLLNAYGNVSINGTKEKPVIITGQSGMTFLFGNYYINNAQIYLTDGLGVYDANLEISNSTITNADTAITARSSKIKISDSKITDNRNGIVIQNSDPSNIFQVNNKTSYGIGGLGNTFAQVTDPVRSQITITGSSLKNNTDASIKNDDITTVQASSNWWGSSEGPSKFDSNRVLGLVDYMPWLNEDPFSDTKKVCCSSILFIPGLQATSLYRDERSLNRISSNQLWEPNRNLDVKKLYLNNYGSSTLNSVYIGGPLGKAYGFKDIYGNFMDYLDSLKKDKTVNEWKVFGYDWRKPITEVVAGKENIKVNGIATTSANLVDLVINTASSSKTGKVTLIAHSNGGLVSKYLIKTLEDLGKADLIDRVISVAVPYLGTPQAILGLLHGDDQSIARGVILDNSIARGLGKNMASAYSLLPSKSYFSLVFAPSIAFASTSVKGLNDGSYPKEINTYENQKAFVLDSNNFRKNPQISDTKFPIKGNSLLYGLADIVHGIIDPYYWPTAISKWAIVGWNNSTSKGVLYSDNKICKKGKCTTTPNYKAEKTIMGDGTVVVPSATYNSGDVVSLDLADLSDQEKREISHANILGASSTINSIDKIIKNPEKPNQGKVIGELSKIPGVTIGKPNFTKEPVSLVLSTHSPVDLHVYDSKGRHVGINPNPQGLNQQIEDGLITFTDQDIPGSSIDFHDQSDGSKETYIYLPDNNGEKYSVIIDGNGFGEFTYQIERKRGSEELDNVEYTSIPVTPFTVASTSILARIGESAQIPNLALSSPIIRIDLDGNGYADIMASSTTKVDYSLMINSLKKLTDTFSNDKKRKDLIKKRLDKIEDKIKRGKLEFLNDYSEKLNQKSGHIKIDKLTSKDKEKMIDSLEVYISQFE